MEIYVRNLPYTVTDQEVDGWFSLHGYIRKVRLVKERETGRPSGMAFVNMPVAAEAAREIEALDQCDIEGRIIRVEKARH